MAAPLIERSCVFDLRDPRWTDHPDGREAIFADHVIEIRKTAKKISSALSEGTVVPFASRKDRQEPVILMGVRDGSGMMDVLPFGDKRLAGWSVLPRDPKQFSAAGEAMGPHPEMGFMAAFTIEGLRKRLDAESAKKKKNLGYLFVLGQDFGFDTDADPKLKYGLETRHPYYSCPTSELISHCESLLKHAEAMRSGTKAPEPYVDRSKFVICIRYHGMHIQVFSIDTINSSSYFSEDDDLTYDEVAQAGGEYTTTDEDGYDVILCTSEWLESFLADVRKRNHKYVVFVCQDGLDTGNKVGQGEVDRNGNEVFDGMEHDSWTKREFIQLATKAIADCRAGNAEKEI